VAYGRALAAGNQHDKALFEAESATLCKANQKDAAAAQAFYASELQIAHNVGEAKKHRDEALRLDPNNADAKALKL
jgi:tetratricopeptide (TPR) repeat protein